MLKIENSVLVLVDVQGRLAQLMYDRAFLLASLARLLRGMQRLAVPVIWTEQNPARMGGTVPELRDLMQGATPVSKMSFSCVGEPAFVTRLEQFQRRQVLLAGIETHVCVHQTAADLKGLGYEPHVVADAVSSRTALNRQIGLDRIARGGAVLTTVEMALFEMMRTAEHPAFKDVLRIVK